ncbi:MAG TPA: AmmeMemoRadiSam system protein A [Gemmatimonadales bacterium]
MESHTIAVPELSEADRRALLAAARGAIEARVCGRPAPPTAEIPAGAQRRGVFVTLERGGELRGCIGRVESRQPLAELVPAMALAAALEDPRFAPVTAAEVAGLRVEVSVLTAPVPLVPADPARIVIGKDGLMVRRGTRQGLLLPQVATEWGWSPQAFLEATCRKAGLGIAAWRDPGTEVLTFQAEVFGE